MAFKFEVSNSLEILAERLCDEIHQSHPGVFEPVYIVTQTEGMNSWLKLQLAEKMGIAANHQFLKPNDFVQKIFYLLSDAPTETLSSENISWIIFKILGEDEFIKRFPEIAGYYNHKEPNAEVKKMALAQKVADLFDQYQIYREELVDTWNKNKSNTYTEWQEYLWIKAKELTGPMFPDKSSIADLIATALNDSENANLISRKIPIVYLFGISVLTKYHLKIFLLLSKYIEIHFLLLNPAPSIYWFDEKTEKELAFYKRISKIPKDVIALNHPLLNSWGRVLKDTFSLLFESDEISNEYNELEAAIPKEDTLLHKIQHSIFLNEYEIHKDLSHEMIRDGSVIINSCYSTLREVEALYNYLVHQVAISGNQFSPRDVVVMVSDINLYGSYIKAVFDTAPYHFPYHIADENYLQTDSVSHTLETLLSFNEASFTAEEVMRLLDFSLIKNSFNITDTEKLRKVIDAANIRFGIDGNVNDDTVYVSWKYGLQRIMYGLCMSGEMEYGEGAESFYPLDIVEGNDIYEVTRLVYFVKMLMQLLEDRKQSRPLMEWVKYAEDTLKYFVCPAETDDPDYANLLLQLEDYGSINEIYTDAIPYDVFKRNFLQNISHFSNTKSFVSGGITFCSLIPMRSIPFKIVALLGLNFDKFPRKEKSASFNLMEKKKQRGDRNVKENDKHLFLETLLSAKENLYISYIGQSLKDNSNIPPSAIVDELVDYIRSRAIDANNVLQQLITKQPLHGNSKKYNSGNKNLYSYLQINTGAKENLWVTGLPNKNIDSKEIQLKDLVRFLQSPIKGFYNKTLKVYYEEADISLQENEIFNLDRLQEWQIGNDLLTQEVPDNSEWQEQLKKTGRLPLKNMAALTVNELEKDIELVKVIFDQLTENAEKNHISININAGEYNLSGIIENFYEDKVLVISLSKNDTKYLIEAYIKLLILRAAGLQWPVYLISKYKNNYFKVNELSKEVAGKQLKELIALYLTGHEALLCFDASLEINPTKIQDLDSKGFENIIKKKFGKHSYADDYLKKENDNGFFTREESVDEFKNIADKILTPLLDIFPEYYSEKRKMNDAAKK